MGSKVHYSNFSRVANFHKPDKISVKSDLEKSLEEFRRMQDARRVEDAFQPRNNYEDLLDELRRLEIDNDLIIGAPDDEDDDNDNFELEPWAL